MTDRVTGTGWVVFDWGGVISRWTTALGELADVLEVGEDAFTDAYWAHREDFDAGWSELAYWRAVGAMIDREIDATLAGTLGEIDVTGWLGVDPGTLSAIDELAAAGTRLALLSNAPSSFARVVERQPWATPFEVLLFSGDLRMVKPDPAIWESLCDRLGAPPGSCLFIDDRQSNVDGAEAAGLHAIRFTGADALRRDLVRRGLLPSGRSAPASCP